MDEQQTYCVQLGFHFVTSNKYDIDRFSHIINCKPNCVSDNKIKCSCGKYIVDLTELELLFNEAAKTNKLFIRID